MDFLAYIILVIAAGMLVYNMFCLWENTLFGSDMGSAILFHQGNIEIGLSTEMVVDGSSCHPGFSGNICHTCRGVPFTAEHLQPCSQNVLSRDFRFFLRPPHKAPELYVMINMYNLHYSHYV